MLAKTETKSLKFVKILKIGEKDVQNYDGLYKFGVDPLNRFRKASLSGLIPQYCLDSLAGRIYLHIHVGCYFHWFEYIRDTSVLFWNPIHSHHAVPFDWSNVQDCSRIHKTRMPWLPCRQELAEKIHVVVFELTKLNVISVRNLSDIMDIELGILSSLKIKLMVQLRYTFSQKIIVSKRSVYGDDSFPFRRG